jgi:hypothetical protein
MRVLMHYGIDDTYSLSVRGGVTGKPDSVELRRVGGGSIDIRYDDVAAFLGS